MSPLLQWILSVVVALLAAGGTYATLRVNRPKIQAEAAAALTDTAMKLLAALQEKVDDMEDLVGKQATKVVTLEEHIDKLETELNDIRLWAQMLWAQVVELGGQPIPFERRRGAR